MSEWVDAEGNTLTDTIWTNVTQVLRDFEPTLRKILNGSYDPKSDYAFSSLEFTVTNKIDKLISVWRSASFESEQVEILASLGNDQNIAIVFVFNTDNKPQFMTVKAETWTGDTGICGPPAYFRGEVLGRSMDAAREAWDVSI